MITPERPGTVEVIAAMLYLVSAPFLLWYLVCLFVADLRAIRASRVRRDPHA
jgi:hypothetical protein